MNRKELGKIQSVSFGYGGYQEAQFGVSFILGGAGWGVGDFWGTWAEWSKPCKWTQEDQKDTFGETVVKIRDLLKQAKKQELHQLKGVPVEVTFNNNTLVSWRILKEVI